MYKAIILPVVLYRCDTCSLTLREEHRLKELENRVLRRIYEPKSRKRKEDGKIHNGSCTMRGRDEKCLQNFGQKT
jgi:hypothetical protein